MQEIICFFSEPKMSIKNWIKFGSGSIKKWAPNQRICLQIRIYIAINLQRCLSLFNFCLVRMVRRSGVRRRTLGRCRLLPPLSWPRPAASSPTTSTTTYTSARPTATAFAVRLSFPASLCPWWVRTPALAKELKVKTISSITVQVIAGQIMFL